MIEVFIEIDFSNVSLGLCFVKTFKSIDIDQFGILFPSTRPFLYFYPFKFEY